MKITILNGAMDDCNCNFDHFIDTFCLQLKNKGAKVELFNLKEMNLKYCIGCFSCWWKTPGLCIHKDEGDKIFRCLINSDFIILASPLIAGFTTSLLKKITDRLIVLLHPYFEIKKGEFHHAKRYDRYPLLGIIVGAEEDTDSEDLDIIKDIYSRFSLNFYSQLKYLVTTNQSLNTIVDETLAH